MKSEIVEEPTTTLRLLSAKLRSLAYLIENHKDEVGEPFDISDIYWGIGLLLTEISLNIKTISIQIEEAEVRRSQRKKS